MKMLRKVSPLNKRFVNTVAGRKLLMEFLFQVYNEDSVKVLGPDKNPELWSVFNTACELGFIAWTCPEHDGKQDPVFRAYLTADGEALIERCMQQETNSDDAYKAYVAANRAQENKE